MSNDTGWMFTAGAGTSGWWITLTWNSDQGAQYLQANPLDSGGSLTTDSSWKTRDNNGSVTYGINISNTGPVPTGVSCQYGGV
jgi:hypothetical protein